jgi:hypothetical protein
MSRRPRRAFVLIAALALILTLPASAAANHAWGNYHWARTSNPFTLQLGDNVTSTWDPILATTSSDWTQASVLNTTIVPGSTSARTCKASTGRVQVCDAKYGFNGWLGVAQIWVSGSHITKASVKLNDSYFNSSTYNTTAWRNLVSCQEVGHTFGLDHQDENFGNANLGTCMDYTNDPTSNQHPNTHDYDMLEQIYAHTDSTTTVAASAPSNGPGGSNGRAADQAWGKLVAVTNHGHGAFYVRNLGAGNRIVTHVFWADAGR